LKKPAKALRGRTKIVATQPAISQNCDTLGWRFNVFVSPVGSTALQKTIDAQDEAVIQQFKVRVRYLANTPKGDWKKPHALKLQGVTDIYEIRFKANGIERRPFGFFGPGQKEFTILVWATHKQAIYDPNDAIKTADSRRKDIQTGSACCVPLKIDGEEFPCT
jgi:hypothetical protein